MGQLTLRDCDLDSLGDAIRTLISPLDHPDVDAWRRAVNRELKALLGAEKATFQFPGQGARDLVSDELDPDALRSYFPLLHRLQGRLWGDRQWIFDRIVALGVCDRRELYGKDLEKYYRSEYYNEYIRDIHAYDGLMAAVALPGHRLPAELYFHHDLPHGGTFGSRPLALLRLLHPAFEAGVRAQLVFGEHRARLGAALDALAEGALLLDLEGRPLHRNPAAASLLESDPKMERIEAAVRELARSFEALERARPPAAGSGSGEEAASRTVRTALGAYRLRGSLLNGESGHSAPLVLVTISSRRPERLPDARTLRERFDLTERQAEVALLLARRLSNREIAEALSISRHTARHHTEMVLAKLGISSRRKVRRRILASTSRPGPSPPRSA